MRKTFIAILLIPVLTTACGTMGIKNVTYKDGIVTVGEIHPPLSYISPHWDTPQFLIIHGKRYINVQGGTPCYLKIPELNSILLVTEDRRDHYTFHIINLANFHETRIAGGDYSFGFHIGADTNAKYVDYIENVEGNKITLPKRRKTYKELLTLDLELKKIVRLEAFQYDESGKVVRHDVESKFFP